MSDDSKSVPVETNQEIAKNEVASVEKSTLEAESRKDEINKTAQSAKRHKKNDREHKVT